MPKQKFFNYDVRIIPFVLPKQQVMAMSLKGANLRPGSEQKDEKAIMEKHKIR